MNRLPPDPGPPEDADERYRRASALDVSRPAEAVRRAVLAHAARLAAERAQRPQAPRALWGPALFGTLAAAVLAGILIAPRYLLPGAPPASHAAADVSQDTVLSAPAAQIPAGASAPGATPPASAIGAAAPEPRVGRRGEHTMSSENMAPVGAPTAKRLAPPAPAAAAPAVQSGAQRENPAFLGALPEAKDAVAGVSAVAAERLAREEMPRLGARNPATAGDPGAAFRHAAEVGDVPALQTLLARQHDINARDSAGRTALMLATLNGQRDAVAALLDFGADPNIGDAQGVTPLKAAMAGGQRAIAQTLQRYGAR